MPLAWYKRGMTFQDRLLSIRARVEAACARAGRSPESVRLVAVSKLKPPSAIEAAHALGLRDFGENYVKELVAKREALPGLDGARWHLIGHLQTNKVGKAIRAAQVIHTLDSVRLVQEVDRRAREAGLCVEGFIEVNLGNESQKGGVAEADLAQLIDAAREAAGVELVGLMVIPPVTADAEQARPYFRRLRELARRHGLPRLSMGMSQDFEVAIEEGATDVRIGTSLFGSREAA